MAKVTFGEKSWDEDSAAGGGSKSDFLNMKDNGTYVVRIVGKPYEYAVHWMTTDSGKKRVNCAGKDCFLCTFAKRTAAKDEKASVRYLVPVIHRSKERGGDAFKVAEFGPQVYGQIRTLFKDPEWGDPRAYDLKIIKDNTQGASRTYVVNPTIPKPLTTTEKTQIEEFLDRIRLDEMTAPSKEEQIVEKLGMPTAIKLGWKPVKTEGSGAVDLETDPYNFSAFDDPKTL